MTSKRIDSIDFLRGLAILAVILLHINIRMPFDKSSLGQLLPSSASKILLWSGYYGVIVFFVISGFLITTFSLKRWGSLKKINYTQFYRIRFARIVPCLMGLLIILSFLNIIGIKGFVIQHTSLAQALFSAMTFHLNWLEAKTGYLPGNWDVLWSLSIEETFYLFFPLLCCFLKTERQFIFVMILFVIIGPFARTILSHNEMWQDHSYFSCMDGIALGCLAGLLANKIIFSKKTLQTVTFLGIILTLFIMVFRTTVYKMGLTKIGLNVTLLESGIALLLIAFYQKTIQSPQQKNSKLSIVRWFGQQSYEIYLTHIFFVIAITQIFYRTHQPLNTIPLWYLTILISSGIGGYVVSRYYSEPLRKYLKY